MKGAWVAILIGGMAVWAVAERAVLFEESGTYHFVWLDHAAPRPVEISEPTAAGRGDGLVAIAGTDGRLVLFDEATGDPIVDVALPLPPLQKERGLASIAVARGEQRIAYIGADRHLVVVDFEGSHDSWELPDGCEGGDVVYWRWGFYFATHEAGDAGRCRNVPALFHFDPSNGTFAKKNGIAYADLPTSPLYGHWHGDHATVRAIAKSGQRDAPVVTDQLRIEAESGDDDERLNAGRGFILADSQGTYTAWALPVGTQIQLVGLGRDGDSVYGQRMQSLLRFTRNPQRHSSGLKVPFFLDCGSSRPAPFSQPETGSAGFIGVLNTGTEGLEATVFYTDDTGTAQPTETKALAEVQAESERAKRSFPISSSTPNTPSAKPRSGSIRLMEEEAVWTAPGGATILAVLE